MRNEMSKEIKISVIRESVGRRLVACCCTKVVMVVVACGGAQAREDIDDELAAAIAVLGLAPNNLKAWHSWHAVLSIASCTMELVNAELAWMISLGNLMRAEEKAKTEVEEIAATVAPSTRPSYIQGEDWSFCHHIWILCTQIVAMMSFIPMNPAVELWTRDTCVPLVFSEVDLVLGGAKIHKFRSGLWIVMMGVATSLPCLLT